MRKGLTTLLVILLAVGAMLVSCKAEVGTPADELVSVSFEEAASRSITATLEGFVKGAYYWKYAADKADDSGLTSGETATYDIAGALPVIPGEKGLGSGEGQAYKPYKIPGFSQGLWNFKLWAYKKCTGTGSATDPYVYSELVFYGEAKNVSLSRGGDNTASVVVNPVSEGDGYIKIGEITFIPKKQGDKTDQTKSIEVTNPDGSAVSGISYDADTQTYTVPAGAYKVTVKFTNAAQTIVYGEGYVIATVYSGLETLIGGNLQELVTYAQFDADLNPDAVNVQAESAEIQYGVGDDVEIKTASTAKKEVKTTVARADADAIIASMAEEQGVDTGVSTKLKLTLNVDPTDATETTITYEIGMKATLTYTKDTETQTSEKPVTALEKYVVVEIEMSSGLSDVNVRHSGTPMFKCESKADLEGRTAEVPGYSGFFFYDAAGTLYIKTKNFSPFAISYTAPANYVAEVDGVKYGTLAETVAKVKDAGTSTVKLLADVALTSTIETTKTFTLDLNGFNITAADCRAIWVKEGTLTLTKKGTIAANKVAATSTFPAGSSVIRIGDSGAAAKLTLGADVTVSSDYCYGVTIFGTNESLTLDVSGKIKVTGVESAISGNGNAGNSSTTITIKEGAEIYAENEYAIYHPGAGTLTVSGGKIIGKGGIEAKAGNVIINGGEITATAPTTSHDPYSNGPSTSGYAVVAVSNKDYKGPAVIDVNSGTIIGPVGKEYDDETPGATVNVHARIGYVYYPTFVAAYEAAGPDDTVTLLENLLLAKRFEPSKTVTIAGDDPEKLAVLKMEKGDNRVFSIDDTTGKVSVTLENIYADGSESAIDFVGPAYARGISLYGNEDITLNMINSAASSPYYAINVAGANKNVTINLSDSSLAAGWAALNIWSRSDVVVEDSILSGVSDKTYASTGDNNFGTIVLNGGTANSTLKFSDTTITAKMETGNRQLLVDLRDNYINLEFDNCVFESIGTPEGFNDLMFVIKSYETITFKNCTFKKNGVELSPEDVLTYVGFYSGSDPSTCTITFDDDVVIFE